MQPHAHEHRWSWLTPYCLTFTGVALLGSLLSAHPSLQTLTFASLPFPASTTLLLATSGICVGLILLAAHRATTQLRTDRAGEALLRPVLQPLTLLVVCLVGGRKLGDLLAPWMSEELSQYGTWAYVASLMGSILWLATVWVRHIATQSHLLHGSGGASSHEASTTAAPNALEDDDLPPLDACLTRSSAQSTPEPDPAPSAVNAPAQPEGLGLVVGGCTLLKELRQDTQGLLYLARERSSNQLVAVKTVALGAPDAADAAARRTQFLREANALTRLSHPNLVATYDVGIDKQLGYLVMDHIEGATLSSFCNGGRALSVSQAVNVIATVADALDYAHRQGLVHRAMRPDTIAMTEDHRIKVVDFALPSCTEAPRAADPVAISAPLFHAPECAAGKALDGRADIFSLGIILYALLARPSYTDARLNPASAPLSNSAPPASRSLRSDVPVGVACALERATQPDPARRYSKAGDFAQALRVGLLAAAA